MFFNSSILPLFYYGDGIWGDRGNTTLMAEIQVLHNKAAQLILWIVSRVPLQVTFLGDSVRHLYSAGGPSAALFYLQVF